MLEDKGDVDAGEGRRQPEPGQRITEMIVRNIDDRRTALRQPARHRLGIFIDGEERRIAQFENGPLSAPDRA